MFGAAKPSPEEARTVQSAPLAGCTPLAGWGPEQPSPPTADLEEALQVQYWEDEEKSQMIKPFMMQLIGWTIKKGSAQNQSSKERQKEHVSNESKSGGTCARLLVTDCISLLMASSHWQF